MINAGLSDQESTISLDGEMVSNVGSRLTESDNGVPTELINLESLIEKYRLSDPVLKMDCEGCEYNSILNAANETLSKVRQIMLEYHNGFKPIKEKLRSAGFKVVHTSNPVRGLLLATNTSFA